MERSVAEDEPVYHRVCSLDDLWAGEMQACTVEGTQILVVHTDSGEVRAIQAMCPHQRVALADGTLEGNVLTCSAHLWEVDVVTGKGVNLHHADVAHYPSRVDGNDVFVAVAGVKPKYSVP